MSLGPHISPFKRILFLIALLIGFVSPKPCGMFNLLDGVVQLNQTDFIRAKNDFGSPRNGKTLSLFGWFRLEDSTPQTHNLLRVAMLPGANDSGQQSQSTWADFGKIIYNNTNSAKPSLSLTGAFNDAMLKTEIFEAKLPLNAWLFLTYTFDYEQKVVALMIKGVDPENGTPFTFYGELKVNYPAFEIPEKMEIDVGCFPKPVFTEQEKKDLLKTCVKGPIRDFGLMLEFAKNPNVAYLLKDSQPNSAQVFSLAGKNHTMTNQSVVQEAQGLDKTLVAANVTFQAGSKPSRAFKLSNPLVSNGDDFVSGMTFFAKLSFEDTLPDAFLLYAQKASESDSINHLEVWLINSANKARKVEVRFPGKNSTALSSDPLLAPGKNHKVVLSFGLYDTKNFAVIIEIDEIVKAFEGIGQNLVGNWPLFIPAERDQKLQFDSFTFIPNSVAAAFQAVRDPAQKSSDCLNNCYMFNTLNYEKQKCLSCESGVLGDQGKCEKHCPKGFLGENNACTKCQKSDCGQIPLSRFFAVKKLSPTQFVISASQNLGSFKGNFTDLVDASVIGLTPKADYNLTINATTNSSATYIFSFADEKRLQSSVIKFAANPLSGLYDNSGTLVQGAAIEIAFNQTFDNEKEAASYFVPKEKNSEMPVPFKDEFVNHKIEKAVSNLGIAAFAIFLLGMFIGILGIFMQSNLIVSSGFFYQKVMQSFMMFYYIAFWLLYNSQLPRNLANFLQSLFKYSLSTHQIFNKAAMSDFKDQQGFKERWSFLGYWRFKAEGTLNSFVLNFGLIFVIQASVIFVYALLKLIWLCKRRTARSAYEEIAEPTLTGQNENASSDKNASFKNSFIAKIVQLFEWRILISVFLIFLIEATVFSLYNLIFYDFGHSFWTFSFAWSVIYFIISALLVACVFCIGLLPPAMLHEQGILRHYGFIYEGLQKTPLRRCFQGWQYLHYFLFAIFLTAAFPQRLVQIIPNLVAMTLLMCLSCCTPPVQKFDKIEQVIAHVLLWIAKVFLAAIVIDDSALTMSGAQRWILGFVALITAFVLICWNTLVILWKFFALLAAHFKARKELSKGIILPPRPAELASMKGSLPHAMQEDVDGSNRIIGFDEEHKQLFVSSRMNIVSEKDALGTKRTSQLDKYIDNGQSNRVLRPDSEALTFANSNNYIVSGNKNTMLNAQANPVNRHENGSEKNLVANPQPPSQRSNKTNGDFLGDINSRVFQDSRVSGQPGVSQRQALPEDKTRSTKNVDSRRNNELSNQPQEFNNSMANSYTSDRFTSLADPNSLKEVTKDNFSKKKDGKVSNQVSEKHNVIIEEGSHYDTITEQDADGSMRK